jgi:hypothetical protein
VLSGALGKPRKGGAFLFPGSARVLPTLARWGYSEDIPTALVTRSCNRNLRGLFQTLGSATPSQCLANGQTGIAARPYDASQSSAIAR